MGTLTMLVIPWTIILIFRISAEIKILRRIYYTFTFLALILIIEVLFIFVTKALGKEFFDYHGFSIGWAYSNYLAAIANLLFPLSYMLCFVERRWRILNIIVTTGLMFCILLTISRGGIIILFISLSLILLFQTIYWKRFYYVWIYLLFLTGIILFLNYTHIGERTIARLNTISPNEPAIAGRFVMWRESVSCIKASPLIGFGPNQKEVLGTTNPHNYFLKIGFELGILGIIVFIWLLNILLHKALSIKKLLKNKREAQFLSIAFLTTIIIAIVNSLFEPTFSGYHYNPLFWFIMGILYLTYETSRTKETVIF
jgi:O-antigen ligase